MYRSLRSISRKVVVIAVAVVTTTACGSTQAPEPDRETLWRANLAELTLAATEAGASERQLDVLARMERGEELSYEDIRPLVEDAAECFEGAGATFSDKGPVETVRGSGVFVPEFLVFEPDGMTESAFSTVYDKCSAQHLNFALAAYSSAPAAVEAFENQFDVPDVRACLMERGYQVPDDMTAGEISALVSEDALTHGGESGYAGPCLPDGP